MRLDVQRLLLLTLEPAFLRLGLFGMKGYKLRDGFDWQVRR
jgi:hypothetical protein